PVGWPDVRRGLCHHGRRPDRPRRGRRAVVVPAADPPRRCRALADSRAPLAQGAPEERAMTRPLRRSHLVMWLLLAPAAVGVLLLALLTRPAPAPQAPPPGAGAAP